VRRLRSGRSGGSALLGVVAAAVLVVALVVVGRSVSGHATRPSARPASTAAAAAPYRIGGRVVCPLALPVLATSDGRSYPPGHPARPPRDADPLAYYDTVAQAAAAGYPRAALPAGAAEVAGVYLLPTSERLRGRCRQAAARLGLAVPCPTVLPAGVPGGPPPTVCDRRWRPCGTPESGFLLEATGFLVPSGYIGAYPEDGERLVVAAAGRPAAFAVACAGERPLAHARLRGTRGRLSDCPFGSGPHEGLLLRWRERGAVMALSVSGRTDPYRRLALGLAARLELVPPADGAGVRR
jgi:hypothetical protein